MLILWLYNRCKIMEILPKFIKFVIKHINASISVTDT